MKGSVSTLLLEFGVATLLALLLTAIHGRLVARPWVRFWQRAFVLLALGAAGALVQHIPAASYLGGTMIYQVGRTAFAVLVLFGAMAYARPERELPVGPALGAAALYGVVSAWYISDATSAIAWNAPASLLLIGLSARYLARPGEGRTLGEQVAMLACGIFAASWALSWLQVAASASPVSEWLRPVVDNPVLIGTLELGAMASGMLLLAMEEGQRQAQAAETRLQALIASTSDALLVLDGSLRVLSANPAAQRIFASDEATLQGREVLALVEVADPEALRAAVEAFQRGRESEFRLGEPDPVIARRDDALPVRLDGALWRLPGGDRRVAALLRDVTAREEQRTRQVLQVKTDAVRQLAAGIAHDFNNLLTTISTRSALLTRELGDDPRVRATAEEIAEATDAAARLARDLLALSGRQSLQPAMVDINSAVRALEGAIRERLPKGVTADFRYALDAGRVRVDGVQLGDALLALAQNAGEAMEKSGGRILVATARGQRAAEARAAGADERAEYAYVSVHDTGPGLSVEARSHLFEPFYSTKGEGRGLGLPTALGFAQQSGGWLAVQSSTAGTIARLGFPVMREPVAGIDEPPTRPSTGGRWALLCEDEPAVREVVQLVLRHEGYRVIEAGDGEAALEAWGPEGPELAVLIADVAMPRMGGPELARRVRLRQPNVPVILMSGYVADDAVRAAIPAAGVTFLQKPFDVDALTKALRDARANRVRS